MSAVKRRAGYPSSPDLATPDSIKRIRKRNDDTHFPDVETVETTQELGQKIIGLLKRSQDKNGRQVATNFLELPDRNEYPDYYQKITLPMCINGIERDLEAGRYNNMTALESDLKRVVQNAKDYNSSKSAIFEDAERIRKALSNFMPKHNPAYLNPDYRAVATMPPENSRVQAVRDSSASGSEHRSVSNGPSLKLRINTGSKRRQSQVVSEVDDDDEASETMADMQLALLEELSAQENAINFEEKPNKREIPHYYKVIERPTSISDVRSMVEEGEIKNWTHLADEVRLIWSNAKEYNEPGSEIYIMAEELERWFQAKLQEQGVPPKVLPKITFKPHQPPKPIKLKIGTPVQNNEHWKVDSDALERQKAEMASALAQSKRGSSRGGSTPALASSNLRRSMSIAEPTDVDMTGVNGHADRKSSIASESTRAIPHTGPNNIPTPAMEGEPPRYPLKVLPYSSTPLTNGHHISDLTNRQLQGPLPIIFSESNNPIERKLRDPGKGLESALLDSVTYMTHPQLPNDPKWRITRYASPTKTQTSHYIYLPHDHYYLRVIPNLSAELKSRKKHKVCVAHNWIVQGASPSAVGGGVFDFRLQPGENVVTVDVIAELKEGEKKEYAPSQLQVDFERITFYIVLRERDAD